MLGASAGGAAEAILGRRDASQKTRHENGSAGSQRLAGRAEGVGAEEGGGGAAGGDAED